MDFYAIWAPITERLWGENKPRNFESGLRWFCMLRWKLAKIWENRNFCFRLWLDVISGRISLKCCSENKEVLNHKIILQTIIYVSPPCGQLFAILLRIRVELNTNFLLIIVNNKHFLQPINSKSSGHSVESTVTEFFLLLQKSW